MDWDGDGRTDLLVANSNGYYEAFLSTGTSYVGPISTSIPWSSSTAQAVTDINGDGLDDILSIDTSTRALSYVLHNGAGQPPDLLSSVTDGWGNSAHPTYVSIAESNYSSFWNANFPGQASFPDVNYVGPLYVVNQTTHSDPSSTTGGAYQDTFWYYDAWMNLQGRGFGGFKQVGRHDLRTGLWETTGYAGAFPASGVFAFDLKSWDQAGNQPIRYTFANVVNTALDGTPNNQRYFVYDNSTTTENFEVGGSKNGQRISIVSTSYAYDNYGNQTSSSRMVSDTDSTSPYNGKSWTTTTSNTPAVDTANWCLTLLSATQISYSTTNPGELPVTRTRWFTPDLPGTCRYKDIVTEPNSATYKVTEELSYDGFGNPDLDTVTGVGMTPRQTSFNWGPRGQFPMTIQDPTGAQTTLDYDFNFGALKQLTDPNTLTTSWIHGDSFGRVTQENDPDGTSILTTYNACAPPNTCNPGWSNFVWKYQRDTQQNVINQTVTAYDALNRPMEVSSRSVTGSWPTILTTYDSLGHVATRTAPFYVGNTSYLESYQYDVLDRITQSQRPINASNSTPQSTGYQYLGDTTIITDAESRTKTLAVDPNGWLRSTQDGTGYSVILGYDAAGGKTSVTDSLGNTLWSGTVQYGIAPFTIASTDSDLGAWSYTYDPLGELVFWQDAKGQHFSALYDALSRMTDRYEPDLYTHWTWGTSVTAREIGQLHSVCTGTGANPMACSAAGYAESESYDSLARRFQRAIQIPGDGTYTYTLSYSGTTGLPDTVTYPTGNGYALQLKYGYQYGQLQSVTDISDTPNLTLWTLNATSAQGQPTQETLANGVVVNHSIDAVTGLPSSITAGIGGGAALQNNSYLFDRVGNLIQRQDGIGSVTENVYPDALNRLDHTAGDTNTQMSYDAAGRIQTFSAYGATVNTRDYTTPQAGCTYNANAQMHAVRKNTQGQTVQSFCYDANGNMLMAGAGAPITWYSYNQPFQMTLSNGNSSLFYYDDNHQRWKQTATYAGATETTLYIGGLLEKVTNSSGTSYRNYVDVGNSLIVFNRWSTGANTTSYLTKDHLGSMALITDSAGALITRDKFAAWGWAENSGGPAVTRHGFTGEEDLDNLSYVDMNGRIYAGGVVAGIFLSPDPTIPDPTDTRSYNRYAYARYNPLSEVDPTGFEDEHLIDPVPDIDIPMPNIVFVPLPADVASINPGVLYDPGSRIYSDAALAIYGPDNYFFSVDEGHTRTDPDGTSTTSLVPLVEIYHGAPIQQDFLGQFNPATSIFKSAYGDFEEVNETLAALFGDFGVRVQLGWNNGLSTLGQTGVGIGGGEILGAGIGILTMEGSAAAVGNAVVPAAQRAVEIANTLGKTKDFVTIAVTDTAEGARIVSSSENALRPAALGELKDGEIPVTGPGHAEVTGVNAATSMGLTPVGTAASRPICPACAQFLLDQGVTPLSPLKQAPQ